jgi:hypothetical protein
VSLALLSWNGPLAIDQPEDHLDNAYLYTTFAKNVRRAAKRRQLILSTHSANIVCLAGTGQVIAPAVKNREGYAAQIGSVDETRGLVEQDLEGGRTRFCGGASSMGIRREEGANGGTSESGSSPLRQGVPLDGVARGVRVAPLLGPVPTPRIDAMTFRSARCIFGAFAVAASSTVAAPAWAAGEVTLARAYSAEFCAQDVPHQTVSYVVHVQNLSYAKTVAIHAENADGTWSDLPAHYVESSVDDGLELWEADATSAWATAGASAPHNLEFAVSYSVNGVTYWDNNDGSHYVVGQDDGPLFGANTQVLTAYAYAGCGGFNGAVDVANLGYAKDVSVVYTTDGWATTKVLGATFQGTGNVGCGEDDSIPSPNPEGVEHWTFADSSVTASSVTFAVAYAVGGTTYWDNNLGQNYVATSAGASGASAIE